MCSMDLHAVEARRFKIGRRVREVCNYLLDLGYAGGVRRRKGLANIVLE